MRSTRAIVNLDNLAWNLHEIRRTVGGRKILAMVKANAYGHGMIRIAHELQRLNADMLGVAFVDEGIELRNAGVTMPIMVLTPPEKSQVKDIVDYKLITVVCDLSEAQALNAVAQQPVPVHVYVDTGMRRDGVSPHGALEFIRNLTQLTYVQCTGILTHFATADEVDSVYMREQLDVFTHLVDKLKHAGYEFDIVHAANTGATFQGSQSHFDMVRTGLSLYGYQVPDTGSTRVRPVLSWITSVLSTRRIFAGDSVSYGRRWIASQETTIATIPVGYGDGYTRDLTNRTWCLIKGKRYPIVGTICMDECMVDVGDDDINVGDQVALLGVQYAENGHAVSIDANDLAGWCNTIPYEVTTAISGRVPRVYVGEGLLKD